MRNTSRALAASLGMLIAGCGKAKPAPAPSLASADVHGTAAERRAAGAELYVKYCALCHAEDATGYAADHAPSLVSVTFLESASNDFLARSIRNGRPGTAMAAYGKARRGPLEEDEIAALIEFLRWPGPSEVPTPRTAVVGDASRGEPVFTRTCQPCHGTREKRAEFVHLANPELLDSASDAFLRHAIVRGRPGTPMLSFAGALDTREIGDVVAFVRSWRAPVTSASSPVADIPKDLPLIIHPDGPRPSFTLREERFVPAEQVKHALEAGQRLVILDARAPSDWLDNHIPGSVPSPYYELTKLDVVPKDGTFIIAYCACPHHASGAVIDELRRRGFKQTAVLDEGILVWKQRGYPIEGTSTEAGAAPSAPTTTGR